MKTRINFIKYRTVAMIISLFVILSGIWFIAAPKEIKLGPLTPKGFNLGIDFQGGLTHQFKVYSGIDIGQVRESAAQAGLGSNIQEVLISNNRKIGKEQSFILKTTLTQEEEKIIAEDPALTPSKYLEDKIKKFYSLLITKTESDFILEGQQLEKAVSIYGDSITGEKKELRSETRRVLSNVAKESENVIAPVYSKNMRQQAVFLILFILFVILLYISFRFKPEYAVGAIAALFHDTLIILGIIAFAQIKMDLTVVAAILTIIGYSINDTIVVFDRIRENTGILKESHPFDIFNISINQTLSRTIITSVTTLLVVISLYFLGGQRINGFALTMLIGIIVGTYSSVFIAAPIVYLWIQKLSKDKKKYKKMELKQQEMKKMEQEQKVETEMTSTNDTVASEEIHISRKKLKKLTGGKKRK